MGFFSWRTNDSDRSISNRYSNRGTFTVHMKDNKGNVWVEEEYDGYGRFAGKDYFELLAEMNGLESDRDAGLDLKFKSGRKDIIYPALFDNPNAQWEDYRGVEPENCEFQGFFYEDEDEEDDW